MSEIDITPIHLTNLLNKLSEDQAGLEDARTQRISADITAAAALEQQSAAHSKLSERSKALKDSHQAVFEFITKNGINDTPLSPTEVAKNYLEYLSVNTTEQAKKIHTRSILGVERFYETHNNPDALVLFESTGQRVLGYIATSPSFDLHPGANGQLIKASVTLATKQKKTSRALVSDPIAIDAFGTIVIGSEDVSKQIDSVADDLSKAQAKEVSTENSDIFRRGLGLAKIIASTKPVLGEQLHPQLSGLTDALGIFALQQIEVTQSTSSNLRSAAFLKTAENIFGLFAWLQNGKADDQQKKLFAQLHDQMAIQICENIDSIPYPILNAFLNALLDKTISSPKHEIPPRLTVQASRLLIMSARRGKLLKK